ncbi:LysM domain-containing protein [Kovacikia minuta CCNUW1]|uniref:LysM domain-containing protein n=1 Tax=Kovacikia minuta TaxID=2931930 RepID=UPI001CC99956|nr:LysM domain-containing protein [Kovacikia minuta]UBF28591.1 LysM domain-containing protein [Kovacikia minuta CCNUW1]
MFDPTSRYYSLETAQFTSVDGRQMTYVRRRMLPQGTKLPLLGEVTLTRDDRLDRVTAQTLGDALQFWQICDANDTMNPTDLISEPTQTLKIPMPFV